FLLHVCRPTRLLLSFPTRRSSDLKWSALFFVAAFGLLTVAWDYGARRSVGQRHRTFLRWFGIDAVPAFVQTVVVAGLVYLVSWSDRKSTRLNSSHVSISYAVFCLK